MAEVRTGRWTVTDTHEDVTVFLIGMRLNRPLAVRHWWPVFVAMPRMLRHLATHPDAGLLGMHNWFGRTTILLTYWRSPEHLQRFAADRDAPHLEPWRRFVREIGGSGDVGIWHETYRVGPHDREVIYADMPAFGLAKVLGGVPVAAGRNTARQRMRGASAAAPDSSARPATAG